MQKLESLFSGEKSPGLYRFGFWAKPESILGEVESHGWQGFHVNGKQITDKASFIQQFADELSFPDYRGSNWDAFEDCITDMAWLPASGYVVLYDHARCFPFGNREDWQMAKTILVDVTNYWESKNKPMYILLRHTWWTAWDIERI